MQIFAWKDAWPQHVGKRWVISPEPWTGYSAYTLCHEIVKGVIKNDVEGQYIRSRDLIRVH